MPVPPLSEQKRIVARIEERFSELDKAVETLNTTKQQLAVLKQACENFEEFVEMAAISKEIKIVPFGTMLHKEDYILDGKPIINPQHIKNGLIVPSVNVSISEQKAEILSTYKLKVNDIIMGRRGEMGGQRRLLRKKAGGFVAQVIAILD